MICMSSYVNINEHRGIQQIYIDLIIDVNLILDKYIETDRSLEGYNIMQNRCAMYKYIIYIIARYMYVLKIDRQIDIFPLIFPIPILNHISYTLFVLISVPKSSFTGCPAFYSILYFILFYSILCFYYNIFYSILYYYILFYSILFYFILYCYNIQFYSILFFSILY